MRRRIREVLPLVGWSLGVVVCLALLVVIGFQFVTADESKPKAASVSNGKITHINGTKLSDRKITRAGDYIVMPRVIYADGGPIDFTLEENAITAGLTSVDALKAWGLCSAELWTQAKTVGYYADSIDRFPEDLPFHREAKKDGSVSTEDAALAEKFRQEATRYNAAAELAKRAKIQCVTPGRSLDVGNYARLTAQGEIGAPRTVEIPDTAVVDATLEGLKFEGMCASAAQEERDRLARRPIDTKPRKYGTLNTTSQRSHANSVRRWTLRTQMLRDSGIKIRCSQ